jgi:FixJ family two-component response regulator
VNDHSSKLIARDLNISFHIVEVHRARIMQKMGTESNGTYLSRKYLN